MNELERYKALNAQLVPCYGCKGKAVLFRDKNSFGVMCQGNRYCKDKVQNYNSFEEAVFAWNHPYSSCMVEKGYI